MSEESAALLAALAAPAAPGVDEDILYLGSNPRETLAHYRILFPELIAYRGGLFVERNFDKDHVDALFDQAGFDGAASPVADSEENLNALSLLFEGEDGEPVYDPVTAAANAEAIGWVWKRWVRETYGVEIEPVASVDSPDACYVTFRSVAGRGA